MSFLDSLESNLKNLEARTESAAASPRERRRREADRARMLAEASHAEELKASPFTSELLKHLTRIGFETRTKVRMAWIGTKLRFEARDRKMELRPTADGIVAAFIEDGEERKTKPVNLAGNAEALAREWLG